MGCGQSKNEPERQERTSKLIPLLRPRRNEDSSVNLSKKELLKHGVHHEDDQSLSNSNSVDEVESVRPPAKVEEKKEDRADKLEERKEDKTDKLEEKKEEKADKLEEKKEEKADKLEEKKDQEKAMPAEETDQEENKGEDEEESEDEGRLSNCYLCPEGSPSFRVYCVDQSLEKVEDDTESKKDVNDESDQKSQGVDGEIAASADSNENWEKMKEKGKKGKRFSKVMGMGKTGAVKNLFNVNSCYHRRHDSPRLLAQNATA